MKYGVTHLSVIPMRAQPSECAEMVSQLLFGDAYLVVEEESNWLKIQTCDCDYEGWIDKKLFNLLPESEVVSYLNAPKQIVNEPFTFVKIKDQAVAFPIFIGSSFPTPQNGIVKLGNILFEMDSSSSNSSDNFISFAKKFLHAPYLWGGRSIAGIDCSGFSQLVYKSMRIAIPRDASQQALKGETVDFVAESKPGDLAFFQNDEGKIIHVGIIIGEGKIIHASGWVRIDIIDETGIYNVDTHTYTHNLRIIKRLLP